MKPISAICFDLDNTLWDRDLAALEIFSTWLTRYQSSLPLEEITAHDNHGHSPRLPFFQWLAPHLHLEDSNQLWHQFQQEITLSLTPSLPLIHTLEKIKHHNIPTSILSDGGSELQRRKIDSLGIFHLIDQLFISAETGYTKPDSSAFQQIIDHTSTTPEHILYIGDHWQKDILGAHHAGMQVCAVIPESDAKHLDTQHYCQHHIHHPNELPSFLNSLLFQNT